MASGGESRGDWDELLDSMKKLQTLFEDAQRDILKPDHFKYALALASQHIPGNNEGSSIPMVFKRRLGLIKRRDIRIMVAGDISAGKSTLLNVLMGKRYLPVQFTPTTKVFCELHDCLERSATLQFELTGFVYNEDKTITLHEDPNHPSWNEIRRCIKTRKYEGKQLRKVVIKWPIDIRAAQQINCNDPHQTTPMKVVGSNDPHQTTPMKVVGSNDPHQTTPMKVVGSNDPHQTTPMKVVDSTDPHQTTPMKVVGGNHSIETKVMKRVGERIDSGLSVSFSDSIDVGAANKTATEGTRDDPVDDFAASNGGPVDGVDTSSGGPVDGVDASSGGPVDGVDEHSTKKRSETISIAGDEVRDDFNLIFVDTPGITSKADSEREVFEEIDTAGAMYQAFILVIKDMDIKIEGLQTLMEDIENSIKDRTDMINPECTLFIANKFDLVPEEERDDVKQLIKAKLLETWPRIDRKDILFMSAQKNVIYGDNHQSTTNDNFLSRIRKFVTKAIRISVEEHCLWLLNLLEITRAILKTDRQWVAIRHTKNQLEQTLSAFRTEAIRLSEELNMRPDNEHELEELYKETSAQLKDHLAIRLDWDEEEINREIPDPDIDWTELMAKVDDMICKKILDTKEKQIQSLRETHQTKWENIYRLQVNRLNKLKKCLEGMSCNDGGQSDMKEGIATALLPVALSGVIRATPIAAPFLFLVVPLLPIPLLLKSFFDEYKGYKNEQLREKFKRDKVEFFRTRTSDLSEVFQRSLQPRDVKDLKTSPLFCKFIGDFPKVILAKEIEQVLSTIQMLRDLGSSKKSDAPKECDKYLAKTMEIYTNGILIHEIDPGRLHWERDREGNRKRLGTNGQVYKAKMALIGYNGTVEVAVKELLYERSSDSGPDSSIHSDLDLYRECFLLRQLSRTPCENIVKYHGSSFMSEAAETTTVCRLRLVFELCDGGTLDGVITRQVLNEAQRLNEFLWYALEAVQGLKFLHHKNIIHRDMKPSNCLLMQTDDRLPRVKIADVGVAKQRDLICTEAQKRGTPAYWAPEIAEHIAIKFHSKASDVYSLGLVLWELWFRAFAYEEFNIRQGKVPDRVPIHSGVSAILRLCLMRRPEQRGSIGTLQKKLHGQQQQQQQPSLLPNPPALVAPPEPLMQELKM